MKLALRNLLRRPAFAVTAVLSLALGIGANTAIFTLTNQILLRVLPVKDPQRLVAFHWTGTFIGGSTRGYEDSFSYPMYADLRASSSPFTGIAARYQDMVDVSVKGPAERATAELVSGNYFEVLGVQPDIGRLLTPRGMGGGVGARQDGGEPAIRDPGDRSGGDGGRDGGGAAGFDGGWIPACAPRHAHRSHAGAALGVILRRP